MRLAARAEGCGSIAEGEFRGSVVETINKYDIFSIVYLYFYLYIDHIKIDSHTNMIDRVHSP